MTSRQMFRDILKHWYMKPGPEIHRWWGTQVVPEYTKLCLTKESDRISALSAVAAEIRLATRDDYLAGL